jgi:hypothetical protein
MTNGPPDERQQIVMIWRAIHRLNVEQAPPDSNPS